VFNFDSKIRLRLRIRLRPMASLPKVNYNELSDPDYCGPPGANDIESDLRMTVEEPKLTVAPDFR